MTTQTLDKAITDIKTVQSPPLGDGGISGSEAVLKALLEEGVDTIFGYPGGAIMPIYDALYDYMDKIKHILVRHEQGAIHAAQGYARSSGDVGVVTEVEKNERAKGSGKNRVSTSPTRLRYFSDKTPGN